MKAINHFKFLAGIAVISSVTGCATIKKEHILPINTYSEIKDQQTYINKRIVEAEIKENGEVSAEIDFVGFWSAAKQRGWSILPSVLKDTAITIGWAWALSEGKDWLDENQKPEPPPPDGNNLTITGDDNSFKTSEVFINNEKNTNIKVEGSGNSINLRTPPDPVVE